MGSLGPTTDDHADDADSYNAQRGLIAQLAPCKIRHAQGHEVWNNDAYDFLQETCPSSANPKLWRQSQLTSKHGLFEVVPGLYQVRGFDLSNIAFVEGEAGIIVVDPLTSNECAHAALDLYRSQRGERPVTGLIYTHSHIDHFGGAAGVIESGQGIPIVGPEGFLKEAVDENVIAGPAMLRRARYMYGVSLPKSPTGQIGLGLGMATSQGTRSLIAPNTVISKTNEQKIIDGVKFVFQMVSGTEAPSEFNFYLPDLKALCVAECATHTMHNIVTLRGAEVRDAKAWSQYLDETLTFYGYDSDVLFSSHHWPTWGKDEIIQLLTEQRDMYAYMHDQTVRLMNQGLNGTEIAERLTLPLSLQKAWHVQGYYGSLSHNVKGIYQKYMTWFDGNPVNLWKYPLAEEGDRYIECMGGIGNVIEHAARYERKGDLRFAATLLGHVIAACPEHVAAKAALAAVYDKLGYGCENATWRNFYLTGALDLRSPKQPQRQRRALEPLLENLPVEKWLQVLCTKIDGVRAQDEGFVIDVHVVDEPSRWKIILSNAALTCRSLMADVAEREPTAPLKMTVTKKLLWHILRRETMAKSESCEGDMAMLEKLLILIE